MYNNSGTDKMLLEKKNAHPRDKRISFTAEGHKYKIQGIEKAPISVTTLIHNWFPQFDSDTVIDKMMMSANFCSSKYAGKTKEQIKEEWQKNGTSASEKGTEMHADIERFFNEEEVKDPKCVEFQHFQRFWKDFQEKQPGFVPYRTEWLVYDEDKMLSGSIDFVLTNDKGDVIILDWKRSKEIKRENPFEKGFGILSHLDNCNYNHYMLQLNLYRHLLTTRYNKNVIALAIVVLHPDNSNYIMIQMPIIDMTKLWDELFTKDTHK